MVTRPFDFENADGLKLSGRLELPDTALRGWAIFAHCLTCGKDSLAAVRISRALAQVGIGVLRFDFAGLGASEGEFGETTFATNVADLVAAARAMAGAAMSPALLVGHSFGGAAVLAAADQVPTARAVATIGAPFDVGHVLGHFAPQSLVELGISGVAEVRLAGRAFRMRSDFIEDVQRQAQGPRIANLGRALLVLHAPGDAVVDIGHASKIFESANYPKSFASLDGPDHLLARRGDADHVAQLIAVWAMPYLDRVVEKRSTGQPGEVVAEETRAGRFQVTIQAGGVHFFADEPETVGGLGSGPTPYDLLSSALAACTTMTLRLYADRKGLPVSLIRTSVGYTREPASPTPDRFVRRISLEGPLDAVQRQRLVEIAARCPVHRTLERSSQIESSLDGAQAEASAVDAHARMMEVELGSRAG